MITRHGVSFISLLCVKGVIEVVVPFIPVPIRRTKKCNRCGLLFPKKENECIHCSNLNDVELEEPNSRIAEERKGNHRLGMLCLYLSLLIIVFMIIYNLGL